MREETNIRHELAVRIHGLPAEQIKQAVLKWLDTKEGSLWDLEQTLVQETNQPQMVYGSIDNQNNFVPLDEEEMVAQSLEALDEFQRTGRSISQKTMESWVESLGTDKQFPCPQ
ncbi:MAG: hypothetical protein QNJ55_22660 [Xenococcus sp. MO_188.B8]|nr:hypothetical protein [Xenococcus sp. MO_188.B8]